MKRIHDLVGRALDWSQPHAFQREFELKDGAELVATLRFRSALGSLATAETADGHWTFKRAGFWQTRVTIRPVDGETEVGNFRNNTWSAGGTLELADGRKLRANSNFWMTKYHFMNDAEEPLVLFSSIRGAFHVSSRVEVTPAGAKLAEVPWLVPLGWYLAIKMRDDSAAGGAAAAAAGAG